MRLKNILWATYWAGWPITILVGIVTQQFVPTEACAILTAGFGYAAMFAD